MCQNVITWAYMLPENKLTRSNDWALTVITTPNNIFIENNYGPKYEPCGTPLICGVFLD